MKQIRRYDGAKIIGKVTETPEGFIKATAVVTRSGIFTYRNADGSTRLEYRPPEEVFNEDSLESMKMIPVTNGHPKEFVNKSNAKKFMVGSTGESVEKRGDEVAVSLLITHADAIDAIKNGRRELSLGYDLKLQKTPGVSPEGQRYDAIQRNIEYNHLALVDSARAGLTACLRFDSEDAGQVTDGTTATQQGGRKMFITVNGVQHEVTDAVGAAYASQVQRGDAAETAIVAAKAEVDKATARVDAAEDKVKKAEAAAQNTDASDVEIEKRVASRLRLATIAGKNMDAKEIQALTGKSERDIKIAIIAKNTDGKFVADGKSDDYLTARVDSIEEDLAKPPVTASRVPQDKGFRKDGTTENKKNNDAFDMEAAYHRQADLLSGKGGV